MGLDMCLNCEHHEPIYWRKVNAVHRFFCEKHLAETGQELDDCETIKIKPQWLNELCSRILSVLHWNDNAEVLLPTQDGFFFGSTDYDDYYYQDLLIVLRDCIQLLSKLMSDELDNITYTAWW